MCANKEPASKYFSATQGKKGKIFKLEGKVFSLVQDKKVYKGRKLNMLRYKKNFVKIYLEEVIKKSWEDLNCKVREITLIYQAATTCDIRYS